MRPGIMNLNLQCGEVVVRQCGVVVVRQECVLEYLVAGAGISIWDYPGVLAQVNAFL